MEETTDKIKNPVQKALLLALKAHYGQTDRSGAEYINHPVLVALHMSTEEEKTVALLHDVVEDTPITLEQLREEGFTEEVISAVDAISKRAGEDYFDYLARVRQNPLATAVKLQDLVHNMDSSRLPCLTEKDVRNLAKYQKAAAYLSEAAQDKEE